MKKNSVSPSGKQKGLGLTALKGLNVRQKRNAKESALILLGIVRRDIKGMDIDTIQDLLTFCNLATHQIYQEITRRARGG